MTLDDIKMIQAYFRKEERRNPTETELKVLDTYWSDHCRHTTFLTEIINAEIEGRGDEGIADVISGTYDQYMSLREYLYAERSGIRPVCR